MSGRRRHWLLGFALLLALSCVTPAVAEQSPPSPSEIQEPPPSLELSAADAPDFLPDQQEITRGIEALEREEEAREEDLEQPAAVQEREESRESFAGLDATESKELLVSTFPEQLELLNTDPARFLSDATIVRPVGEEAAVVSQEGDTSLLEAGMPVRTDDEEGQVSKVDLGLVESGGDFEPSNPLVDLQIPASAADPVDVGSEGLGISLAGASAAGQPLGEQNIFYPDVQPDSDLLISPVSAGVELFDQLRSPQSPEALRFHIQLPEGAELRADGNGGAEIVDGDETLASIPFPSAVDAQGTEVPVELHVENDTIILDVAHREGEFAYPILVDPILEDWVNSWSSWNTGHNYQALENGAWQWTSEPYGQIYIGTSCFYACWGSGRGLYVSAPSRTYGSEVHAHWTYLAPNLGSFVSQVWLNPFWREDHGCSWESYTQPHDYDGFWGNNQWNLLQTNEAIKVGSVAVESWGRSFIVGLSSAGGANIPCWRDLMVGGAAVWLDDWEPPAQPNVTGMPTGWLKKGTSKTVSVEAYDPGLGVQEVRLTSPGEKHWPWNQPWCSGLYENRCAASRSGQLTFSTEGFMEGNVPVSINTVSPSGKVGPPRSYELKIDGTAPVNTLSGQLATATAPEGVDKLSLPVYNLTVKAKDFIPTGGAGSGVKRVKVLIDGKEVAGSGPTCSTTSCPSEYEATYPIALTALAEKEHNVEVRAVDFVGNESPVTTWQKKFEYIPATGMKEEYVLQHFVLPDGKNHEGEEYEGPELAVNVMNGNVVYHERDLEVQGKGGHRLELERIYNSMQPTARDGQWGHGWSVAQTPEFTPEAAEPTNAKMLRTSAVTSAVNLPKTSGETSFSSRLHATVAKTKSGGYEVRSTSEDETQVFNSSGRIDEARLSAISPEVTVQPKSAFPAYAESVGSTGAGNGQLSHPADVVKDAKGNLWVVDKANNRLVEFNEAGEYVRTAGSLGSGNGQLNSPTAIAVDAFGDLDVADTGNNRVVRFDPEGKFKAVVGANVNKTKIEAGGTAAERNYCTASSGNVCQAGTTGSGEGLMAEPVGIASSSGMGGSFYVVERANNRVEKFGLQGELLAKFGTAGSGAGQFKEPIAIAIGPSYLWVADTGNNRVEKWTFSWTYAGQFGTEGSGNGQFKRPAAIEADAEGNVWVGDQGNNRLQELSQSGDYITQFGEEGQFAFSSPMGIFLDSAGNLWVTDSGRDQVQEWMTGSFLFKGSRIGFYGTGSGQFNHPADVALDGKSNLWALDKGNNRLEKFNEAGEFVSAVGAKGGGAGQLNAPSAFAIDPSGNLWIADTGNNRIEEFNEAGQFVLTFGREVNKTKVEAGGTSAEKAICTAASGNICQAGVAGSTEFFMNAPKGITATTGGNLWVADTGNNRLKKFSPTGSLINNIAGEGTEAGKVKEPTTIAMGPESSVWVADSGNNRIEEWSSSLTFLRQFGSEGNGNGQFQRPAALDIDSAGHVYVGDQNNDRIQQFTATGEYESQLGSSSQFAFSGPMGLATDNNGGLWVTDTDHNRLQRILTSEFEAPVATQVPAVDYSYSGTALTKMELKEPEAPDPAITISNTSGLATSASTEAATATYTYASGNLTAEKDSEGEVKFERDESNRITKITLPNGTWAKLTYDTTGRATKVIVKPAGGTEQTTNFKYVTSPRTTYVWGTNTPEVVYYFGEDGGLLITENTVSPPVFESLGGSLWSGRNSTTPLENKDQLLYAVATSQNEIASIKVLAGNAVLAEQTCEDKAQPPDHHCDRPEPLEWITNPSEHVPGRLDLEVVATDFQGHSASQRFFVTMPQQPPPGPEERKEPTFASVKKFREDYGLDREHPLTQTETNRLILELLYEWEARYPVAMQAVDSWGVPMRSSELAEMEYRDSYTTQAAEVIPQWATEHAASSYGGYYVDDRAGGVIYVGFTENQHALVESLKQTPGLINPGAIREFPTPPTKALGSLRETESALKATLSSEPSVMSMVTSIFVPPSGNVVEVHATNVQAVTEAIQARLGVGSPVKVSAGQPFISFESRYDQSGPVIAGDALLGSNRSACTAGYGARAPDGSQQGQTTYQYFVLTAGHCYFPKGLEVGRRLGPGSDMYAPIGKSARSALNTTPYLDAGTVTISASRRSHSVLNGDPLEAQPIQGVERVQEGRKVCWSGVSANHHCGHVRFFISVPLLQGKEVLVYVADGEGAEGDSGGPVWDPTTHKAVGVISGSSPDFAHCEGTLIGKKRCDRVAFTALRVPGDQSLSSELKLGVQVLSEG